jgi:hypothetical protein
MFSAIVLASASVAGIQAPSAVAATPQPRVVVVDPSPAAIADTDDNIIEVADDEADGGREAGLSQAVTSLPAEVQMLGYRLMWALAGIIALGGAAISWFLREDDVPERTGAPARTKAPVAAVRSVNGTRPAYRPRTRSSSTRIRHSTPSSPG